MEPSQSDQADPGRSPSGLPAAPAEHATRQVTHQPGAFTADRPASGSSGLLDAPSPTGPPSAGGKPTGLHGVTGQRPAMSSGLAGEPPAGNPVPTGPPAGQPPTSRPAGEPQPASRPLTGPAPSWPTGRPVTDAAPSSLAGRPEQETDPGEPTVVRPPQNPESAEPDERALGRRQDNPDAV